MSNQSQGIRVNGLGAPRHGVSLEGRITAGLALVEQGVERVVARGRARSLAFLVACLSEAYLLGDRLDDAHQRAAQAVELARQYQQRGTQAIALAEERGMRPLVAHCHRGLGMLYAATGQREQVRTALTAAISLYRAMEMTFWLLETEAALAQVDAR